MSQPAPSRTPGCLLAAVLRLLGPLLSPHLVAVALVVVLGIVASAAEGIGITLLIPLIQAIEPTGASTFLPAPISGLVDSIPPDRRFVVLPLVMLGRSWRRTCCSSPITPSSPGCSRTPGSGSGRASSIAC